MLYNYPVFRMHFIILFSLCSKRVVFFPFYGNADIWSETPFSYTKVSKVKDNNKTIWTRGRFSSKIWQILQIKQAPWGQLGRTELWQSRPYLTQHGPVIVLRFTWRQTSTKTATIMRCNHSLKFQMCTHTGTRAFAITHSPFISLVWWWRRAIQ